jgi:hypothetical protein
MVLFAAVLLLMQPLTTAINMALALLWNQQDSCSAAVSSTAPKHRHSITGGEASSLLKVSFDDEAHS